MTKPLPLKRGVRKIIFLDIDGVLNSRRSAEAFNGYPRGFSQMRKLDQVAWRLVKKLCKKTGTSVVVSSTWRTGVDVPLLAALLKLPVIGKTPLRTDMRPRGEEIREWLLDHPEVEKYAIVDDDNDMLPEQLPFFVKTDRREGLSYANFERLMEILK